MDALLFQRFSFKRPIELEDMKKGHEVIALPEKTIIRSDAESLEHDLAELLTMAKMAEIDNLLTTFFFQKNLSEQESRSASIFFQLCQPLQDAWVWGLMRRIVPDIYEKEIMETYKMWEQMHDRFFMKDKGPIKIDNSDIRRQMLGMWAILYENPQNKVDMKLIADDVNREDWDSYFSALKQYITEKPDIKFYLQLAIVTHAPYVVHLAIDETGFRHYKIKVKQ